MFALEVDFLLGRCFSARFDDQTTPEWPPSPSRLFSALAASYFEGGSDLAEREALEWLERCPPPSIRSGQPGEVSKVQAFVPVNYPNPGESIPAFRSKQPRYFPAQGPSDAVVHFMWQTADPDERTREALAKLANRTGCLGRACSLVHIRLGSNSIDPSYVPDTAGASLLHVPYPGRLKELETLFAQNRRPTPGAMVRYREVTVASSTAVASGAFETISFLEKTSGPGLPIEASLTVTEALRAAMMSQAGNAAQIPAMLHGHDHNTHCALMAVPFVQHRHADGHLMGVGLVFPAAISSADRRDVLTAYARVSEQGLSIPGVGHWSLEPVETMGGPDQLRNNTWARQSLFWNSVTPILLDRFPKKNGHSVEQIVAMSCERVGLPPPIDVDHSPWPTLNGVAPVPAYRLLRNKKEERPRWGVHAKLRFAQPVRGPLLLGAGRYLGLGLMRPVASFGNAR